VIDYIINNKQWIFSGVGVSATLIVAGWLFRSSKSRAPLDQPRTPSSVRVEVVQTPPLPTKNIQINSEVASIAKRFKQVLDLMNEKRSYGKYTIAGLAQLMKLHSVGELESVFLGSREPCFEFFEHFCDKIWVN
jgi:hypothetical protein